LKRSQAWSLLTVVGIGTTLMMACAHGRSGPLVQAEPAPRQLASRLEQAPVAQEAQAAAVAAAAPVQAVTQAVAEPEPEGPDAERFAEKDRNGDGWLSGEEFAQGLAPMSPDEAAAMFLALDQDADGQLAAKEYFPDPSTVQASALAPAAAPH
jgi:uncharacterized membrane protein